MTVLYVNDRDIVADLGLNGVTALDNWANGVGQTYESITMPGKLGALLAQTATANPRTVTVKFYFTAADVLSRNAILVKLASRMKGLLEVRFGDASSKVLECVVHGPPNVVALVSGQSFVVPDLVASYTLLAADPSFRDQYKQSVAVTAANTAVAVPCGSLPCVGKLQIMGAATNPTITLRSAGGVILKQMAFTATLTSSEYIEVDTGLESVTKYSSGTATSGLDLWTSGDMPYPAARDGDYENSVWPTLETSSGTLLYVYERRWEN